MQLSDPTLPHSAQFPALPTHFNIVKMASFLISVKLNFLLSIQCEALTWASNH